MAHTLLSSGVEEFSFPSLTQELYMNSINYKTRKLYVVYVKKWIAFCVERGYDYRKPIVRDFALFISFLYRQGLSYSAINIARSAISFFAPQFEGHRLGSHPVICRILLGIRNLKPKISKYVAIWDVDMVLGFVFELWPLGGLPLPLLAKKLVILILLVTSGRIQCVLLLKLSNLVWVKQGLCIITLDKKMKHIRGGELGFVELNAFSPEPRLCVVKCLKQYIARTKDLRGKVDDLIITTVKPYKAATHDTLARWVMDILRDSGVDVETFKSHSTRSATASKLLKLKVPVDQILRRAGWAAESTFRVFYDKQILPEGDVSQTLLNSFLRKK